jgi:hypothetical protein
MTHTFKKELIDQSSHFVAAVLFLAPLIAFPCILTALFAGFGIGFVREISQVSPNVTWAAIKQVLSGHNHRLDMTFWSLGAGFAYLLFR